MVTEPNLISNVNQPEITALGLWQQIKEDWIAHGRDWTKPGFRAVAIQCFGVWRMKIKPLSIHAPAFSTGHCIERLELKVEQLIPAKIFISNNNL